jgi:leucyl aminopeptidase (aminopeptidase T)
VGRLLVSQVYQIDALPILTIIPPLKTEAPPPEPIAEMAKLVDALIAPMTTNIAHTQLRIDLQKLGVKFMVLPQVNQEFLASGAFDVDFYELRPKIEKLAVLVTKAKVAKITTPKGTDLTMSIEGRKGQAFHGFAEKGILGSPPCLEVNCAPVEGTAEGRIVADVSIEALPPEVGFVLLSEPVEVLVHNGLAEKIEGGWEAKKFKEFLESTKDPNVYNIAELGIGMNPNCKPDGTQLMDEAGLGSIHIALGTNEYFPGGKVRASGHYDLIFSNVTLELDGVTVIKDGKLVF